MSGLNDILEIGKRSLLAQRVGIDVAGHNIANASTPGYSRQQLGLVATDPIRESYGLLGTGVMAQNIQRVRADFIDQQIRSTNYNMGAASQQERIISQFEARLNEPSDSGLAAMMTKFFTSFQDLALHPEDGSARNSVVQAAQSMTAGFHQLTTNLQQLKGDLTLDAQSRVDEINRLIKQVYDDDQRIISLESTGVNANDARDARDQSLAELSKLVDIRTIQDSLGTMTITIGGTLVEARTGYSQLATQSVAGKLKIVTSDAKTTVDVQSGELGGILGSLNTTLPAYQNKIDTMASALITRVNALHSAGSGLGTPPPTGINFFVGTDARTIEVNSVIQQDLNNLAASGDGAPGNNDVALALAQVPTELLMGSGSETISQFYNGFVSEVGAAVQSATYTVESNQNVLKQLENQRGSITGVSIDEEMVDLIKFQRGFDAAAKVINTVNEMYGSLLNMV
jgi:flagellar hook-associated protein 1